MKMWQQVLNRDCYCCIVSLVFSDSAFCSSRMVVMAISVETRWTFYGYKISNKDRA